MTDFASDRPIALVTGGRQGLGKAAALSLARRGFDIVILDLIVDDAFAQTLRDIKAAGARAAGFEGDIADLEAMDGLVDRLWNAFGGIDCLVDNAGIAARPLADILNVTIDAFDRNFDINVRGTFFLTQKIARLMVDAKRTQFPRSVIVITAMAAGLVSSTRAQYCMTKASLSMMVQLYATHLAPEGIMVHEVRPGLITTDMTASVPESVQAILDSGLIPLGRGGEPDDVGNAVASLASGAIPYATGQVIWVDGGIHIQRVD